jgi:hypothetical protein
MYQKLFISNGTLASIGEKLSLISTPSVWILISKHMNRLKGKKKQFSPLLVLKRKITAEDPCLGKKYMVYPKSQSNGLILEANIWLA